MNPGFTFEITLDRSSLIFRPNEYVTGMAKLKGVKSPIEGGYVTFQAEGRLNYNRSSKKTAASEALEHYFREPYVLLKYKTVLSEDSKKIVPEKCTWPFKFQITPTQNFKLLESYTGVYISVTYDIILELKIPNVPTIKSSQIIYIQVPVMDDSDLTKNMKLEYPRSLSFTMTPDNLLKGTSMINKKLPKFKITGKINTDIVNINDEVEGTFAIEECDHDIKSIELQLVRVETVELKEIKLVEATEVQNIQIADGNVIKYLELLIFMVLPRFYSCPTFTYKEFTVNFELNLIFIFSNGFKVTHNFPLYLFR